MFMGLKIKLAIAAIVAIGFLALGAYAYVMKLQRDVAYADVAAVTVELDKAVGVNKRNAKVIIEIQEDLRKQRVATEKEIAESRVRDSAIDSVKKEMDNVEGANDRAGPYWDELSKRLHSGPNH